MSNRHSYHLQALDTLERAMRTSGLARDCLMEEAVRLHRLACDHGEVMSASQQPMSDPSEADQPG